MGRPSLPRTVGGAGGLLALLLAAVGLFSVISLAIHQHSRDIGIRMAVGASSQRVVSEFLASGVKLSLVGLFVGMPLGLLVMRLLESEIEDLQAFPTSIVAIAVGVAVVAVASLATWLPARRAATVDPLRALRTE